MKANNAYENGYQNAYGVTSWALSGKKFNVADEAASEAARAVRLGDIKAADSDEFARGFIDFCREHFGDWDAYELAEGYAFRCISAEEAWNSYFWGVAGARAFHVYDDGVLVIPYERAEDVIKFARMQLEDDIKTRGDHYEKLGFEKDETLRRLE